MRVSASEYLCVVMCVCMRARVTCNERMVSFLKLFEVYYVIFLDKIHHKNLHACLDHVHISKLACQGYSFLFVFNQLNLIKNWIKTYSFFKRIYISYLFISISLMEFTFFKNDHVSFKIIESHNKRKIKLQDFILFNWFTMLSSHFVVLFCYSIDWMWFIIQINY